MRLLFCCSSGCLILRMTKCCCRTSKRARAGKLSSNLHSLACKFPHTFDVLHSSIRTNVYYRTPQHRMLLLTFFVANSWTEDTAYLKIRRKISDITVSDRIATIVCLSYPFSLCYDFFLCLLFSFMNLPWTAFDLVTAAKAGQYELMLDILEHSESCLKVDEIDTVSSYLLCRSISAIYFHKHLISSAAKLVIVLSIINKILSHCQCNVQSGETPLYAALVRVIQVTD